MFPTRVHHALLIVMDVALREGPVRLHEIAERQDLHPKSIEMFAQMLRQAGLLASVRGCRGGYILGRPARQITIGEIARCLDAPYEPCADPQDQPLEQVMERVQAAVWKKLDKMTLARVLKACG
jgi:Rrf2 family iron-sulfur cluster assembly transcriptional regulator